MSMEDARKFCGDKMAKCEPKKWPDRKKRMAELYEKRFGQPMPENMLN
jgi:membrane-bound lytic murein transglycosylase MltF